MSVQLSTLAIGSFFKLVSEASLPRPNTYVLTVETGTAVNKLVVTNLTKSQILELDSTTLVVELTLTTGIVPTFTVA